MFSSLQYNSVVGVPMQATFKGWMDIMKHAIDGNEVRLTIVSAEY